MESQRYVTKHQFTHHFCSRDFAIPISDVRKMWVYVVEGYKHRFGSGISNMRIGEHRSLHVLQIFTQETTQVTCRPLALASSDCKFLAGCRQSSFPGSAPAAPSASSARQPIRRPTPTKPPTTLFSFVCLFTPHHTTPPFTTYRHLTLHTLLAPPIHSLHLLAFFLSAATSTSIKCLQTPRSNYE